MAKSTPEPTDDLVTVSLPRSALQVVAPPPTFVDQSTVMAVVGLDRKAYLRHCRAGAWPVTKEGKKLLAKVVDVQAFLEGRAQVAKGLARTRPPKPLAGPAEFAELPLPKGARRAS